MTPHRRRIHGLISLTITAVLIGIASLIYITGPQPLAWWIITGATVCALYAVFEFADAAREERHANDR